MTLKACLQKSEPKENSRLLFLSRRLWDVSCNQSKFGTKHKRKSTKTTFPPFQSQKQHNYNLSSPTDCDIAGAQKECCNGQYCCGPEYFSQLTELPCVNHLGCKDLGYGNFCCPAKGNSTAPAQCCNEDPNPTTTTTTTARPKPQASKVNGTPALTASLAVLLAAPLLQALRWN